MQESASIFKGTSLMVPKIGRKLAGVDKNDPFITEKLENEAKCIDSTRFKHQPPFADSLADID